MRCDNPKCFKTKTNRCMKPNPWIVHLQKNKGKGLTMEQLSQTYATSKNLKSRSTNKIFANLIFTL